MKKIKIKGWIISLIGAILYLLTGVIVQLPLNAWMVFIIGIIAVVAYILMGVGVIVIIIQWFLNRHKKPAK